MKTLAIFWMLLIVLGSNWGGNQAEAKEKDHQKPDRPAATVPQQQKNGDALQGKDQQDVHADAKIVNPPAKDFYDKAPVWINIALLLIALGTGGVIAWQSIETHRAADAGAEAAQAARDSIRLQEAQYRQWIEVGGWKNLTPHPISAHEPTLTLGFEVQNNTDFPLTLRRFTTTMGANSSSSTPERLIAPGTAYPAFYAFDVTPTQFASYNLNNLMVRMTIEVVIQDVLEKVCPPQHFTPHVTFGPSKCEAVGHTPHYQMKVKQTS